MWNPATCSYENGEYSASTIEDSVITFDEIINDADSVSKNVPANVMITVSTCVKSTASTNFLNKKVRCKMDCYILHMVLLVIILLLITVIICYHYTKQKRIDTLST